MTDYIPMLDYIARNNNVPLEVARLAIKWISKGNIYYVDNQDFPCRFGLFGVTLEEANKVGVPAETKYHLFDVDTNLKVGCRLLSRYMDSVKDGSNWWDVLDQWLAKERA